MSSKNDARKPVLVIDDDPSNAILVRMHLDRLGIETDLAADIDPQKNADVVFLDLNLPSSSNAETLERARKTYADAQIICLTGSPEKVTNAMLDQFHIDRVINKDDLNTDVLRDALDIAPELPPSLFEFEQVPPKKGLTLPWPFLVAIVVAVIVSTVSVVGYVQLLLDKHVEQQHSPINSKLDAILDRLSPP